MRNVKIIGGAMTKIGKHMDRNLKSLAAEAVTGALKDARITKEQLEETLKAQSGSGKKIGEILVDKGYATQEQINANL